MKNNVTQEETPNDPFEEMSQQQGVTVSGLEGKYTYVDLGLSVMWATYNVGASKPTDNGDLFAWGETSTKKTFSNKNYKFVLNDGTGLITKYNANTDKYEIFNGITVLTMNALTDYRTVDNKTVLESEDDAAAVNWGGFWRMPTEEEMQELVNGCDWEWTDSYEGSGVAGQIGKSKTNGNTIFLSAAGFNTRDGRIYENYNGFYWSSSLDSDNPGFAIRNRFSRVESFIISHDIRWDGYSVRAVYPSMNMKSYVKPVTTHSITARKSESYTDAERGQYSEDETEFQSYNHNKFQRANSDYVDLGLPSGILWATCNVGATKPEEYGQYFAWGETTTKEEYTIENYKWSKNGDDRSYSKYCNDNKYGKVDKKLTLCSSDDVASVKLGGDWRMPTIQNFIELIEMCDWEWTLDFENSGVSGRIGTSKQNGEIIFFPAAGYYGNEGVKLETEDGLYWSSSLLEDNPSYAQYLNFGKRHIDCRNKVKGRQLGLCIRAVSPKK